MSDPFAALSERERGLLRSAAFPDWIEPMAAMLTDARFDDPSWVFERKLDGMRCLAFKGGGWRPAGVAQPAEPERALPRLVAAFARRPGGGSRGRRRGRRLRGLADELRAGCPQRGREPVAVFLYLFDVLHLDGYDTRRAAVARAQGAAAPRPRVRRTRCGSPRIATARARSCSRDACRKGWEGLIAKRADAPTSHEALARLAQVQVLHRAGARDRGLHGAARQRAGAGRAAARLLRARPAALRGQGRDRLRSRARCAIWPAARAAAPRRLAVRRRRTARAAPPGWSRGWWRRSASANGRATVACAIPASSGCARTRTRATSCAKSALAVTAIRAGRRTSRSATPTASCSPDAGLTKLDLARHYERVARGMVPHVRGPAAGAGKLSRGRRGRRLLGQGRPRRTSRTGSHGRGAASARGGGPHVLADDAATLVYLAGQNVVTLHAGPVAPTVSITRTG